ncbi:hypothetical protein POG22_06905 [Geitlerinema sp. CS-897]|uniref:hypothetical protein n=1 Tax=Baaleninema simplex TaxID=2862350 RepID=UPI000AB66F9B|nr:hypothetical protein [Baaleninema simplex]MDC0832742.1 hypothetical protein [Geitlerinema sp. CS-897]
MTTLSRTQKAGNSSVMLRPLSVYQADHQVKYLHLQAQLDTLEIELKKLKQQQSPTVPSQN